MVLQPDNLCPSGDRLVEHGDPAHTGPAAQVPAAGGEDRPAASRRAAGRKHRVIDRAVGGNRGRQGWGGSRWDSKIANLLTLYRESYMYSFCTSSSHILLTYALTWSHLEPTFIINSLSPFSTWSQRGANLEPPGARTPDFPVEPVSGSRLAPGWLQAQSGLGLGFCSSRCASCCRGRYGSTLSPNNASRGFFNRIPT